MTQKSPPIAQTEITSVELVVNGLGSPEELFNIHKRVHEAAPDVLMLRDPRIFETRPDHAVLNVTLNGSPQKFQVGFACLFPVDEVTVEFGSFHVMAAFRQHGFGSLMSDGLLVNHNDQHNLQKNLNEKVIAKVCYGNKAPLKILDRTGFRPVAVDKDLVHFEFDPTSIRSAAVRLFDQITAQGVDVDADLVQAMTIGMRNKRGG